MTQMRPAWPYIGEVSRSLLGILLAVVVALEWGSPGAAMAAGGSATIAGAAALQDNTRRMQSVLWVSVAAGLAALAGTWAATHDVVFIVVVAGWAAAAGLTWSVSANAGLAATALGALLVTCGHQPAPVGSALITALLALGGGLAQVPLVAAWPRRQWHVQRIALTTAYRSVATGARNLASDPAATLDVRPLITLRDAYTRPFYGLPERIAMTLTALRADSQDPDTHTVVAAAADTLDALSGSPRAGDAEKALTALDDAIERVPKTARARARRLQAQLHEATALRFTGSAVPISTRGSVSASLRAQLRWTSPILRHAIRLGGAAAIGTAVAAITDMPRGYWITLTVLLVLRPETAHTYTRCIIRVLATIGGITLATSITVLWHPTGVVSAVFAVLFIGAAYAVQGLGHVPAIIALTAAIVFLIDIDGAVPREAWSERLVAASLGAGLAIASHVSLPDSSLVRLYQRAGELLKAENDYAATVIRTFVHPVTDPETMIAGAWERTVRARSAFEAASGSAHADAPAVRRWLTTYRAGLNAVTASCAALERHVAEARPDTLDRRFVVAVDDYVDALRGDAPLAGKAWTLDVTHLEATEQQLRESATSFLDKTHVAQRVLAAEVETITRHLMSIADAES